ncbi:MAG: hypothetical protein ACFFBP_21275 [Promethearchaeota archaeon]
MYEKSLQNVGSGKLELFSSFFAAINTFVSELVKDGSRELKNISMGEYTIITSSLKEIKTDVVMIADKDDFKTVNKILPKIIKILYKHKELLLEWNHNKSQLNVLDPEISEILYSKKQLLGDISNLTEDAALFLKSMWSHRSLLKGELSQQERENLLKERDFLSSRLDDQNVVNLFRKLAVCKKIIELSEKLNEEKTFIEYQNRLNKIKEELNETFVKLRYYLKSIKETLSKTIDKLGNKSLKMGDYKDCYLSLYSFSNKVKTVSEGVNFKKYRNWAMKIISKEEVPDDEFSEIIMNILKMSDNLEDYIDGEIS